MDHHTRTEFRLEPGGLRRHDVARIGNVDELLHGNRVECESRLHLAAIDTLLQLFQAANTADEIDPFRRPQILVFSLLYVCNCLFTTVTKFNYSSG